MENSFWLNPLQCGYFYNTQFNYWLGLLAKNIILVFERFGNLNRRIFNKNKSNWWVWSTRNASWVICNMAASTFFMLVNASTLKEYEIIALIYNRKTCRLESLQFIFAKLYQTFIFNPQPPEAGGVKRLLWNCLHHGVTLEGEMLSTWTFEPNLMLTFIWPFGTFNLAISRTSLSLSWWLSGLRHLLLWSMARTCTGVVGSNPTAGWMVFVPLQSHYVL